MLLAELDKLFSGVVAVPQVNVEQNILMRDYHWLWEQQQSRMVHHHLYQEQEVVTHTSEQYNNRRLVECAG